MTRPKLRDLKYGRYQAMVKYKAVSPICVGSEDEKDRAILLAKSSQKFERVWVVDSKTGRIIWEQKKGS
jgi:hypothetical protein